MEKPESLFLIAGSGMYPRLLARAARDAGVARICAAAFTGETAPELENDVDRIFWMRVGQLGKLLAAARESQATHAVMAGQIAPSNLFNLRPDMRALMLLAKLPERNAETLFGELARQLETRGLRVMEATCFMESHLAAAGPIAGPKPKPRQERDLRFGFEIAKETSRLDIGQTVVVKNGTVLAVEAFEGTDECIRRGGKLGRGNAIMIKVSKPNQDLRFDVPVVGTVTIDTAREAGVGIIAVEAGKTLLLDREAVCAAAESARITLFGITP